MHLHIDPYRKFTICSMFAIRMSLRLDISWWHRIVLLVFGANFDILFDLTRSVSSQPIDDVGSIRIARRKRWRKRRKNRCFYIDEAILFYYYRTVSVCVERVYAFMRPYSPHILIDFVGFPFVFFLFAFNLLERLGLKLIYLRSINTRTVAIGWDVQDVREFGRVNMTRVER